MDWRLTPLEAPADDGLEELLPGILEHVEGRGVEEHLQDSRRMEEGVKEAWRGMGEGVKDAPGRIRGGWRKESRRLPPVAQWSQGSGGS